jgi:hypothetical protein
VSAALDLSAPAKPLAPAESKAGQETDRLGRGPALALLLIVLVGAALRLANLDLKTITHPEVYVPGIPLPAEISDPPPRLGLGETIWFHLHGDPHPPGFFVVMWFWTSLFGTSLTSIRMPSAILGIASIPLLYRVTALPYGWRAGLLAAALLAFNGHHVYWSQMARMYAWNVFLGLLSTLLLLKLSGPVRRRGLVEAAYVAVLVVGIYVDIFFWPFLAAQMLWTLLYHWRRAQGAPRLLTLQALVVALGAPMWAHAIEHSRASPLASPSEDFLREFLGFGFLFESDDNSDPPRPVPRLATLALAAFSLFLLGRGLLQGARWPEPIESRGLKSRQLLPAALIGALLLLALSATAPRREAETAVAIVVPLLAVALPLVAARVWPFATRWLGGLASVGRRMPGLRGPFFYLAFLPAAITFTLSFWHPMLGARLYLMLMPYQLALIAAGTVGLLRWPWPGIPIAVLLAGAHLASVVYFWTYPTELVDYKELAAQIRPRAQPGDLLFINDESYLASPIFYYLDARDYHFVAEDYDEAVAENPNARVWVFEWPRVNVMRPRWTRENNAMRAALEGYRAVERVQARRVTATVYERRQR